MTAWKAGVGGFVLGLAAAAVVVGLHAGRRPPAMPGAGTPNVATRTATPETRTVYVYRDAKKPVGASPGSVLLTEVKTKTGTAAALLDTGGHASIVLQDAPAPWFARAPAWDRSLYIGFRGADFTYRVTVIRDRWQIKQLRLGVAVSIDYSRSETKGFIGIGGRF